MARFAQPYLETSLCEFNALTARPPGPRRKCVCCCFLAHTSAGFYQAAAQHFWAERRLCGLDTASQSHTGSSYVSPIKWSSPAFIPAKEVHAEIRSHSSWVAFWNGVEGPRGEAEHALASMPRLPRLQGCQWTLRLLPHLGYCTYCYSEHKDTYIFSNLCFEFLLTNSQKVELWAPSLSLIIVLL